ncbi:CKLF-like MARVEL transmembrane domain-containing protein 6 [Myripristis murdjan]|uniref:CKLF-like MARVEL transmembrane domain containing 6 n=1 Tax=Myripristis murdjan TaxID=586833 RepID=A0A667Z4L9_9TELE|nr:CKLF-like MARVEL transmembrane domain-containing protein 6 [Myripristis murdjan]
MAAEVYSPTTEAEPKSRWFVVPTDILDMRRFLVKVAEVLLSLVAFVLEEAVTSCINCSNLYFFEFISCTAFLFTLLLLILLATKLHDRVGINCWASLDFLYTVIIAVLFFIASAVFAGSNGQTPLERAAVVFGFLSTAVFIADAVLFWKSNGLPFRKGNKPESSNGTAVPPAHETERLNTGGNAAE